MGHEIAFFGNLWTIYPFPSQARPQAPRFTRELYPILPLDLCWLFAASWGRDPRLFALTLARPSISARGLQTSTPLRGLLAAMNAPRWELWIASPTLRVGPSYSPTGIASPWSVGLPHPFSTPGTQHAVLDISTSPPSVLGRSCNPQQASALHRGPFWRHGILGLVCLFPAVLSLWEIRGCDVLASGCAQAGHLLWCSDCFGPLGSFSSLSSCAPRLAYSWHHIPKTISD